MPEIGFNVGWKLHFDPIDESSEVLETLDRFLKNMGVEFKRVGLEGGGDPGGKYYTVYPQSLERRDKIIPGLERLSYKNQRLIKMIDSSTELEGNQILTPGISGRFTTGYTSFDPKTGEPMWDKSELAPNEARASNAQKRAGRINHYIKDSWSSPGTSHNETTRAFGMRVTPEELAEDIELLKKNYPEIHEMLVGKPGYKTPYRPNN